jgi:hypothetical protein
MLEKYCIKSKYNQNTLWAMPINAEQITKHYIRAKSASRQKEEVKKLIKRDIGKVSEQTDHTNTSRKENRPFFQLSSHNIKKFEKRASRFGSQSTAHPIVEIFDDKSMEVIDRYKKGEDLQNTKIYDRYPDEKIDDEEVQN